LGLKKIKILKVDYTYDYDSDSTRTMLGEGIDWQEVTDEELKRIRDALAFKYLLPAAHPLHKVNLMIVEEVVPYSPSLEELLKDLEEAGRKQIESKRKREAAAAASKALKEEKALERKKKTLEKLKAELEGQAG